MKSNKHTEFTGRRARKSAGYRKVFDRTLQRIDLALLVREMPENAGLTQAELAKKVGTTQSAIARLEDAEYAGHSPAVLERIAAACGVGLSFARRRNPISTVKSPWFDTLHSSMAILLPRLAASLQHCLFPRLSYTPCIRRSGLLEPLRPVGPQITGTLVGETTITTSFTQQPPVATSVRVRTSKFWGGIHPCSH